MGDIEKIKYLQAISKKKEEDMNYTKIIKIILLTLLLAEIIMSLSLAYKNWKSADLCIIGESCTSVQGSIYGDIGGIKVSYMAIAAFLGLLIIYFVNFKLFLFGTVMGTAVSFYFIALQLFLLKEICTSCMFIDSIMIIIFGLTLVCYKLEKKKK